MPNQTVRKRVCKECGNVWFTVEITVPTFAVGWSRIVGQGKPVLRVPVDVTLEHVEAADSQLALTHSKLLRARKELTVTDCDSPTD